MGTRPPTLEEPRKNEPIPDITNPEVDEMVILPIKRKLVRWYLLAILFIVLFVPWTDPRYHIQRHGYSLLFFPPKDYSVVDYGIIFLEVIAVTCIAGLVWLIQKKRVAGEPKTPVDYS